MTPDERRRDKARRVLRQRGTPSLMTEEETRVVVEKVRDFHARGMTVAEICAQTHIHKASVYDMCRGVRTLARHNTPVTRIRRTTGDAVMRHLTFGGEAQFGPRIPVLGSRRRLQALSRVGFSQSFMSEFMDISKARVSLLINDGTNRQHLYIKLFSNVCQTYDKLYMANPRDFGLGAHAVSRTRNHATRMRYAPPGCWDADTMDHPDTIPEWTGECGTTCGHYLHRKYHILPICAACIAAKAEQRRKVVGGE